MSAEALGKKVFLLTDCLISKSGADISVYPRGTFFTILALQSRKSVFQPLDVQKQAAPNQRCVSPVLLSNPARQMPIV